MAIASRFCILYKVFSKIILTEKKNQLLDTINQNRIL